MKDETTQERCPRIEDIRGAVARGWCHEKNSAKVMDTDLAEAISQEIYHLWHDAQASAQRSAPTTKNEVRVDVSNLPKHKPFVSPASVAELRSTPEHCPDCHSQIPEVKLCLECRTAHSMNLLSNRSHAMVECDHPWHNSEAMGTCKGHPGDLIAMPHDPHHNLGTCHEWKPLATESV